MNCSCAAIVFQYSKRMCPYNFVPNCAFRKHAGDLEFRRDPNVWCCIFLLLCTLGLKLSSVYRCIWHTYTQWCTCFHHTHKHTWSNATVVTVFLPLPFSSSQKKSITLQKEYGHNVPEMVALSLDHHLISSLFHQFTIGDWLACDEESMFCRTKF